LLFGSSFYLFLGTNNIISDSILKIITLPIRNILSNILNSDEVRYKGCVLLKEIFNDKKSEPLVQNMLNDVLMSERFLEASKKFGIKLIDKVKDDEIIQNNLETLMLKQFKSTKIKEESIKLVNFVANQPDTKHVVSQFFKVVFLREDIVHSLTHLFNESAFRVMDSTQAQNYFSDFIGNVWADPLLRWNLFKKSFDFWSDIDSNLNIEKTNHKHF
jgi:hypothetical protein